MTQSHVSKNSMGIHAIDQRKATALDQYAGIFCGDIFLTARSMFDRFHGLKKLSIDIRQEPHLGYMFSAYPDPDHPHISVNTDRQLRLDDRMIQRLKDRFQFSDDVIDLFSEDAQAARPLILAHEIGHIIQMDSLFLQAYGTDYSALHPMPHEDYAGYVMSDSEVSADFIAASIVANTEYGSMLDMEPWPYEPSQWREWSEQHPMTETLRRYGALLVKSTELA